MKGTLAILVIGVFLGRPTLAQNEGEPNVYTTGKFKYFIETKQKYTWLESMEECKSKHMNLVVIDTQEKADDVEIILKEAFLYKDKPIPRLYIGAHDLKTFRKFIWVATDEPFTYTNWEKNEPNNYQKLNERCVHIGFHGTAQWNDINCKRKYGFICEYVLGVEDLSNLVSKF